MIFLRKLFFFIFTAVYLVSCPLVILYSLGYLWKPGMEHGFVGTGLVSVSTLPEGASVYLENKRYTQKTPTLLRDLLPGDYFLKVSLKDYRVWTRRILVKAEKAEVFEKILLLPKAWRPREVFSEEFQDLIPLGDERFFMLTRGYDLEDFSVYDQKQKKRLPVVSKQFPFKSARVLSCFSTEGSGAALLAIQMGLWGEERFLWIEPTSSVVQSKDISHLFIEKPDMVQWDAQQPQLLFLLKKGILGKLEISSGAVYPKLMEAVNGFGLFRKKVYTLSGISGLRRLTLEDEGLEALKEDTELVRLLSAQQDIFRIEILPRDRMLFWGRKGTLFVNRPPYQLTTGGVRGIRVDHDTSKVLVWRDNQLGVLDFLSPQDTGEWDKETAAVDWIFSEGKKISQAFWVYGSSHVLFRDDDMLYLMEQGSSSSDGEVQPVLKVRRGSSIIYYEAKGILYFLDAQTGHLSVIQILPKQGELI